ncbi:MAG TPA: response regulator [Geomonas sp.]
MGNRLLLADDSITIQKVVAIIFANEEFELTVVDNGTAALQKAREVRPDVLLVDALMPGKTGYEVCEEIRRDPELSSTPILLLIGAFEPFDEEKARDCGADATISKPFESQQLIDRVKELLELGRTRAAAPAPAPAARQLPIETAAEELWGDLSSFDTMPLTLPPVAPVAAPATPAPAATPQPKPPAAPVFTAPAAPAPAASQPAPAAPPYSAPREQVAAIKPAPIAEEIVEASFEDDLWGAFELEEAPQAAAPVAGFGALEAGSEFEAEEFFSFEDESEAIEETGPALFEDAVEEPPLQPSAEEMFSFADEPMLAVAPAAAPASEPEPFNFPVYEPFSFEPEAEAAAPAAQFAPEPAASVPFTAPPAAPSAPVFQPQAPEAAQSAAQPASFALSEADLVAALSKISREVIERIVWEVVPDLAELLIKEEIRKLRAGSKG